MASLAAVPLWIAISIAQAQTAPAAAEETFWSFRPIRRPPPVEVKDASWPLGEIDRFVLARLESNGLKPARPADRRTLLRRLSFDLTGLPPAPEEAEAFARDRSREAVERVVDRLLASPRFGERWGRYWLDVARYAEDDIRGLSQESYPNAWRYRDWVIGALNEDMPYDAFVKAQIAGDLLAASDARKLMPALGFLGLGPWYYDIAVPAVARADERHERIDALSRGLLGLTVGCARCHDHKFDPITMRDYYGLAGIFASSEYREYPLADAASVEAFDAGQRRIQEREAAIRDYRRGFSERLAEIQARRTPEYMVAAWEVLGAPKRVLADVAIESALDRETLERWTAYLDAGEFDHPYLQSWEALIGSGGGEDRAREVGEEFERRLASVAASKKRIDEDNRILLAAVEKKKSIGTKLPNGFLTYEDFCAGCQVQARALDRDLYVVWDHFFGGGRRSEVKGRKTSAVLVHGGGEVDRWLEGEWKAHLTRLLAELEALKKSAPPAYPFLHGIAESSQTGDLRIHLRGSPFQLGETTPRGFPAALRPQGAGGFERGSGRLELAEAIARHPLAARVMANRLWQRLFGSGIVATPSNFGHSGAPASHPDLLEHLAWRFVEQGYSVKRLLRDVVLSRTYQLSGEDSPGNAAIDAGNRLLWRANRRRLDVEALRDSILWVAGTLDARLGGPSVDLAADRSRRSVYGKVSRFRLNETLALFDFPDPSTTSEQRHVTHVPMQKLFHLNSDFIWDQAGALAARLEKEAGPGDREKLGRAWSLLFQREPSAAEIERGSRFLDQARADGASRPPVWRQFAQVLLAANELSVID